MKTRNLLHCIDLPDVSTTQTRTTSTSPRTERYTYRLGDAPVATPPPPIWPVVVIVLGMGAWIAALVLLNR